MQLPSKLNDGSILRELLILAIVESKTPIRKIDDATYELTDADGVPTTYDLPEVVGPRMAQLIAQKFGMDLATVFKQRNRQVN
jgi:hypothetical protein